MEWSDAQIAASSTRFDGGRDYRGERSAATVAELRREEAMVLARLEAKRRLAKEMGLEEGEGVDGPVVERDWGGRIVHRPARRMHAEEAAKSNLDPSLVPSEDAPVFPIDKASSSEHGGRRHYGSGDVRFGSYAPEMVPRGAGEEASSAAAIASGSHLAAQVTFQTAPDAPSSDKWRSVNGAMLEAPGAGKTEEWQRRRDVPGKKAVPDPHGIEAYRRGVRGGGRSVGGGEVAFGKSTGVRREEGSGGRMARREGLLEGVKEALVGGVGREIGGRGGGRGVVSSAYRRGAMDEEMARVKLAEKLYKEELEKVEREEAARNRGEAVPLPSSLPVGYTGKLPHAPTKKTTRDIYFAKDRL